MDSRLPAFPINISLANPLPLSSSLTALGVDPETGMYTFEDYDGDGAYSSIGDRQWVENLAPKWYGGLGNSLDFGDFALDVFFKFNKQRAYNTLRFDATPGFKRNTSVELYDRWQRGQGMKVPSKGPPQDSQADRTLGALQQESSAAVSDASFLRLRSISLNYKIPSQDKGPDINVYLQGQNLWTLTNYKGPDPEQPTNSRLPTLRQITLGLQVSF